MRGFTASLCIEAIPGVYNIKWKISTLSNFGFQDLET